MTIRENIQHLLLLIIMSISGSTVFLCIVIRVLWGIYSTKRNITYLCAKYTSYTCCQSATWSGTPQRDKVALFHIRITIHIDSVKVDQELLSVFLGLLSNTVRRTFSKFINLFRTELSRSSTTVVSCATKSLNKDKFQHYVIWAGYELCAR